LVTTIPAEVVPAKEWHVRLGEALIPSGHAYSTVRTGEAIALAGSHGWVEIAINHGNASHQLGADVGSQLQLWLTPQSNLSRPNNLST